MENQCQNLTMAQFNEFIKWLHRFEEFIDGKIGTWKTDPADLDLKEDVKPICWWTYPVPKVYGEMFKKEVEILFPLGSIEVANDSEWGASSSVKTKYKSNQVCFMILLKLDGFQYSTSIYLNMGYYHIQLIKSASNFCKIILLWGKYCYKRLPIGAANST